MYLLFAGNEFYPHGGWEDFRGGPYATQSAAITTGQESGESWWQVVDLAASKVTACSNCLEHRRKKPDRNSHPNSFHFAPDRKPSEPCIVCKARKRLPWTVAALANGMPEHDWEELGSECAPGCEPPTYADRMLQIVGTAEILEAYFLKYGPRGSDQLDPNITIDNVCDAMVVQYKKTMSYLLTEETVKAKLDWSNCMDRRRPANVYAEPLPTVPL